MSTQKFTGSLGIPEAQDEPTWVQPFAPSDRDPLGFTVHLIAKAGGVTLSSFSARILDISINVLLTKFFDAFLRIEMPDAPTLRLCMPAIGTGRQIGDLELKHRLPAIGTPASIWTISQGRKAGGSSHNHQVRPAHQT